MNQTEIDAMKRIQAEREAARAKMKYNDQKYKEIVTSDTQKFALLVWEKMASAYIESETEALRGSEDQPEYVSISFQIAYRETDNICYNRLSKSLAKMRDYNRRKSTDVMGIYDFDTSQYLYKIAPSELFYRLLSDGVSAKIGQAISQTMLDKNIYEIIIFTCSREHIRDIITNADKLNPTEPVEETLKRIKQKQQTIV